jgi:hypothetical protein
MKDWDFLSLGFIIGGALMLAVGLYIAWFV